MTDLLRTCNVHLISAIRQEPIHYNDVYYFLCLQITILLISPMHFLQPCLRRIGFLIYPIMDKLSLELDTASDRDLIERLNRSLIFSMADLLRDRLRKTTAVCDSLIFFNSVGQFLLIILCYSSTRTLLWKITSSSRTSNVTERSQEVAKSHQRVL